MDERIGFGLYHSSGNKGSVGRVSVFGLMWCGCCMWAGVGGLDQGLEGCCGVMFVLVVSLDSLCRWHVHVSVYCARRIHAHLRCTPCSILLHLIDIYFLPCICLWQISQILTCLCVVVEPGFVSTSPSFVKSSASHPVGPHSRLA